jgi:hypothetical protein
MLPILRILPVGGVLLAVLILVLALSPPDGTRAPLSSTIAPPRSVLLDRERQAEVRQFLIHAALKRADELNRLRDLPDTPAPPGKQSKVASLPGDGSDTDPDEPASINEAPVLSTPTDIGEPFPTELPLVVPPPAVAAPEESAPATKNPERGKSHRQPQREVRRRPHRVRLMRPAPQPRPLNVFEALFGPQQRAYGSQQPFQRYQPVPDIAALTNPSAFSIVPRTNPY